MRQDPRIERDHLLARQGSTYGGKMSSMLSLNGVPAADAPSEAFFRPVERLEGVLLGKDPVLPGVGASWGFPSSPPARISRHVISRSTLISGPSRREVPRPICVD